MPSRLFRFVVGLGVNGLRVMAVAAVCATTAGCAVTMYGHESVGGGSRTVTTSSAVSAEASGGHGRVRASFGSQPPPGAPGGTVSVNRGASAVLLLGVMLGGAVGQLTSPLRGVPAQAAGPVPDEPISRTCSCYGWTPDLTVAPPGQ